MDCMQQPGSSVLDYLPEFAQTHVPNPGDENTVAVPESAASISRLSIPKPKHPTVISGFPVSLRLSPPGFPNLSRHSGVARAADLSQLWDPQRVCFSSSSSFSHAKKERHGISFYESKSEKQKFDFKIGL